MADLPNGFDRADGLNGNPGTPTPQDKLIVTPAGGSIEEYADSPEIERGDQATLSHRFRLSWNEALTRILTLGRGTVLTDSSGNVTKVLTSKIQHDRGEWATLIVTAEGLSFDSPPDQFQITPVELGINIMKHPRYFYAFLGDGYGSTTEQQNQMVIRLLQDYMENPSSPQRNGIVTILKNSIGSPGGTGTQPPSVGSGNLVSGTDLAKRAALEIIQKYWRGEETPYVVGLQITWSSFYFRPPYLNLGGYVEDPMTEATPQLPDYFYSVAYPPNSSQTIFDILTYVNPQCYSSTGLAGGPLLISWLRKADQIDYERTWFKVDRTWIGSPVGFWDAQLYNNGPRPQVPSDYLAIL